MLVLEKLVALGAGVTIRPGAPPRASTSRLLSDVIGTQSESESDFEDEFGGEGFEVLAPENYRSDVSDGIDKNLLFAFLDKLTFENSLFISPGQYRAGGVSTAPAPSNAAELGLEASVSADEIRASNNAAEEFIPAQDDDLVFDDISTPYDRPVSAVSTDETSINHSLPSVKRHIVSLSDEPTEAVARKAKKRKSSKADSREDSDGLSKERREELRLLAKKFSKAISKRKTSETGQRKTGSGRIKKGGNAPSAADDMFVRHSILDHTTTTTAKGHSNLGSLFGLGKERVVAPAPRHDPTVGPLHPCVMQGVEARRELMRPAGAMLIYLRSIGDVPDLLNNLTAKITKAVRQNGGFASRVKSFQASPSEPPRFANRTPHRLFVAPSRYTDGRTIGELQKWDSGGQALDDKKVSASVLDAEMRALNVGRTLAEDVIIVSKNAAHLYLFGLNSEYGDTANLESDLRYGRLTPAPIWIHRKPYVQMVINGLQYRGCPHVIYAPDEEEYAQGEMEDAQIGDRHRLVSTSSIGQECAAGSEDRDGLAQSMPYASPLFSSSHTASRAQQQPMPSTEYTEFQTRVY